MFGHLLTALATIGLGFVSAFVPIVNAEAMAATSGVVTTVASAAFIAIALAAGQTAGKVTIFYCAKLGRRSHDARRAQREQQALRVAVTTDEPGALKTATRTEAQADTKKDTKKDTRAARIARRLDRTFQSRRSSAGVTLASAAVGLPPLLLVSAAAGAAKMRIVDFVACCFVGRAARFAAIAIPIALAMH